MSFFPARDQRDLRWSSVRLPTKSRAWLQECARENGTSFSEVLRAAVDVFIALPEDEVRSALGRRRAPADDPRKDAA